MSFNCKALKNWPVNQQAFFWNSMRILPPVISKYAHGLPSHDYVWWIPCHTHKQTGCHAMPFRRLRFGIHPAPHQQEPSEAEGHGCGEWRTHRCGRPRVEARRAPGAPTSHRRVILLLYIDLVHELQSALCPLIRNSHFRKVQEMSADLLGFSYFELKKSSNSESD